MSNEVRRPFKYRIHCGIRILTKMCIYPVACRSEWEGGGIRDEPQSTPLGNLKNVLLGSRHGSNSSKDINENSYIFFFNVLYLISSDSFIYMRRINSQNLSGLIRNALYIRSTYVKQNNSISVRYPAPTNYLTFLENCQEGRLLKPFITN